MARGEVRAEAILAATLAVVGEVGYEAASIDEIARRAGASKATLYRRWRNKAELVRAALDRLDAGHNEAIPDTGALRTDLLAVMASIRARATAGYLALITELALAARRDPDLAAALRSHVGDDELSPFREVLQRGKDRGELSPEVDPALIHDLAEAMIQRQVQVGGELDEAFALRVVDSVILPLISRGGRP
jgi:AcrR family transcriptional regulator